MVATKQPSAREGVGRWKELAGLVEELPGPLVLVDGNDVVLAASLEARGLAAAGAEVVGMKLGEAFGGLLAEPPATGLDGNQVGAQAAKVIPGPDGSRVLVLRAPVGASVAEVDTLRQDLDSVKEDFQNFAYVASHDLQEPLRMVSSYVRLLQRRYADDLPDDAQEFMLFAVDGAKRMSELLKGLLEFSRVTTHANESEPALASELVAEAWKRLAAEVESASASLDVPEELPRVHVDREQALRVFTYLLENATRFAGEEPPKIEIRATLDKRMAVFTVSDNGIGIPEKDQERVFTLFQRLHSREDYPGIGKGLAVARRIVERHGGWIGLESTEGKGTTVRFSLPLAEEAS